MSLKIGSITIPDEAAFDLRQTLDPIDAKTLLRTKNGSGILQSRYQKLQSSISGSGWLPDGLDGLDLTAALAVSCIEALSITGATTSISIPRAFRTDTDFAPQGLAIVNGDVIATALSLAGSVATLTAVAGASAYQVLYFPVITGFITVSRQFDKAAQTWSFTLDLQEQ